MDRSGPTRSTWTGVTLTGPCLLNQFSTVWTAPVSAGYGLIRDPNDSGLQHDVGIFDVCLRDGRGVHLVRPELSGIRHNLDQNYQLSFSRNLTSAFDQTGGGTSRLPFL